MSVQMGEFDHPRMVLFVVVRPVTAAAAGKLPTSPFGAFSATRWRVVIACAASEPASPVPNSGWVRTPRGGWFSSVSYVFDLPQALRARAWQRSPLIHCCRWAKYHSCNSCPPTNRFAHEATHHPKTTNDWCLLMCNVMSLRFKLKAISPADGRGHRQENARVTDAASIDQKHFC